MQADKWSEILGSDIPNLLKASMDLEAKLTPMLAQIQLNRSSIDESLLKQLDATMEQIKEAKAKLCQSK
jgi:hypothetical protein